MLVNIGPLSIHQGSAKGRRWMGDNILPRMLRAGKTADSVKVRLLARPPSGCRHLGQRQGDQVPAHLP